MGAEILTYSWQTIFISFGQGTWEVVCCYRGVDWPLSRLRFIRKIPVDCETWWDRRLYIRKDLTIEIGRRPTLWCPSLMKRHSLCPYNSRKDFIFDFYHSCVDSVEVLSRKKHVNLVGESGSKLTNFRELWKL